MDIKRLRETLKDVKSKTQAVKNLCHITEKCDPVEEAHNLMEKALEMSKKKDGRDASIAFEQRLPTNWGNTNVINN